MQIDNTEMLVKIHEMKDLVRLVEARLEENAHTDAQKETLERIKLVFHLQNDMIDRLLEHHLDILDHLEKLATKLEEKK